MTMISRIGKRERGARKKRKRGTTSFYDQKTAGWRTLKLGHKKFSIHFAKSLLSEGGRYRNS